MIEKTVLLIVDDSKMNRRILRDTFQGEYTIIEAPDGCTAIEIMEERRDIALMILDLNMPKMNGFDVLKFIKRMPTYLRVPVIVNTQFGEEKNELEALRLGAKDFITKPYNPEIVRRRVANVLAGVKVEKDSLTGIYTRSSFCRKTAEMLKKNQDTQYMLICLDIERFKIINDVFGMETGDRILCGLAAWLGQTIRKEGTYGRMEGDKFAACIPEDKFTPEQLLAEMEKVFQRLLPNYSLSAYLGIYPITSADVPVNHMCDRAILALRTVKGNYIRRYAFYDESVRKVMLKEQNILNEMGNALENGEFCTYLQPIYNIVTGEPVGAEALVRWVQPDGVMMLPGEFIPLFERNGFISQVDAYVWESVCQYLAEAQAKGERVLPVSVNVSRIDFYNPNLANTFEALIEKYGLDSSLLKVEITETEYMDNPRQLLETMEALQEKGFEVLVDDFGSGYSSLNMLKDVPADVLKIDMKFLDNMEQSERAANIIQCVARMAREIGMDIIVEGVEKERQVDFLKSISCEKVQGFYYSRPISLEDYRALLKQTLG